MIDLPTNPLTPRQEAILDAAGRLFRRQGFNATSMREIAAAVGYNTVAGLYNHFDSKDAIFTALLERRAPYDAIFDALETVEGDTAEEYLRDLLRAVIPIMLHRLDFLELALIDLQELEGQLFAKFIMRVIPRFQGFVAHFLHFPELRQDLPPATIMRLIVSIMIGYLITEMVARTHALDNLPFPPVYGEAWLEGLVSILMRGLSKGGSE